MGSMGKTSKSQRSTAKPPSGIVLAWCHPGQVSGAFLDSVFGTLLRDNARSARILRYGGQISLQSGPRIAEARSQIVHEFLTNPLYKEAEWLWMVDVDMTWEAKDYELLLNTIDAKTRPIVGGLCFAGGRSSRVYPTLYRLLDEDGTMESIADYPKNTLVKVDATGAAFLMVHRSVLHKMGVVFGTQPNGNPNPYPWFVEGTVNKNGEPYGEDITFCLRANHLEIPIYVHTGITVGHIKSYELTEDTYQEYREKQKVTA